MPFILLYINNPKNQEILEIPEILLRYSYKYVKRHRVMYVIEITRLPAEPYFLVQGGSNGIFLPI